MRNDKIKLIIGLLSLFIIFAVVFTAFYIYRDDIYHFLVGDGTAKIPSEIPYSDNIPEPAEYLNNIVFLGDSIIKGFDFCRDSMIYDGEKILENVTVVASSGYGLNHAVSDVVQNSVNLIYDGKAMEPENIIAQRDEKYVFICLGLNDLSWMKVDKYIENYRILVENIKFKNPDKIIAILSVTPLVTGEKSGNMDNGVITAANNMLIELASEQGVYFIDWAAAIRDENNGLHKNLSSDGYCHLKVSAYNLLVEYLLHHPIR